MRMHLDMTEALHDWRWFNHNNMAVKRTDHFTYTVWRWVDRDGWGAAVDLKLEHQLVKDLGFADGDTWEDAINHAKVAAIKHLELLQKEL